MTHVLVSTPETGTARYSLLVANDGAEVRAAQRLRHQVFAEEMGATLRTPEPGLDVDRFDEFCDHLIVREDTTGEIVGTYRMLSPDGAARAGGLYSQTEFDLSALAGMRDGLVETGRSCVHADHRNGAVVSLVWAGIARYMLLSGKSWLAGCASVPLTDGGTLAAGVWNTVRAKHYADERYRVQPLNAWDVDSVGAPARTVMPPLLKGYLRLGAWVCGPPAHDADFGVADFFVLLGLEHIDQRYLKFFLGE
ncbi:GNAT family N-acetyltransferase [Actinokineospora xionganensis]|uniref:GNAT family N-acetyltransferase n=1 Tax=Actinokineospora xionganensis TaxID=2684470 RepID=A0ABR7L947_9PSEU|nr:GNAT family N-acyltransferase [Actinokineospora xionganensis]MBC6448924.1 GNAT family N-acetyltransferase [Actinokineospora xionganensis]